MNLLKAFGIVRLLAKGRSWRLAEWERHFLEYTFILQIHTTIRPVRSFVLQKLSSCAF